MDTMGLRHESYCQGLTRARAQTQGATNSTSQGYMSNLCRSEGRRAEGETRKRAGEGTFGQGGSSLGELAAPTLRPCQCKSVHQTEFAFFLLNIFY